jgi:choline kinase
VSERAIILAAGRGMRLGSRLGASPKCLLELGGATLLERQLASLRQSGVTSVTVVAGFEAARVASACAGLADVLVNDRYAETNSLFSLWLARPLLDEGFIVLNGDVLFHRQLLRDLLSSRFDDALLVAFRDPSSDPFGDEEMKVKVRSGRVADIAKTLDADEADGENVGIARFSRAGAALLVQLMDEIVSNGGAREFAPRAFQAFARRRPLHAVGTRGYPWIEIDFPADYDRAATSVLPLVDEDGIVPEEPERRTPAAVAARAGAAGGPVADWRPQIGHV